MKQVLFIVFFLVLLSCAGGAGYLGYWYIPQKIEKQVTENLQHLGFGTITFKEKSSTGGKVVIQKLSLDKENYSSIESVTVLYSTIGFLMNGGRAESLIIKDMHLTGEISKDGDITISGWDDKTPLPKILALIPAANLVLESGSIDLLSAELGGLKIDYDIQVQYNAYKPIDIRGRLSSAQRKLGFEAKIDGKLDHNGQFSVNAAMEQIQLHLDDIEIKRCNAKATLTSTHENPFNVHLEGDAGAIVWQNMPLREVKLTYENSGENYNIYAEGRTIGAQNVEFTSNINHVDNITSYEATLSPKNAQDLIAYLQANRFFPKNPNFPALVLGIEQPVISIDTSLSEGQKSHEGTIKVMAAKPALEIDGSFQVNHETNMVKGMFSMPETTAFMTSETEDPATEQKNSAPLSVGISASGNFEINDWKTETATLSWFLDLLPEKGTTRYGALELENIRGSIRYQNPPDPEKKSGTRALAFELPLKEHIAQKGRIYLNLESATKSMLRGISFAVYGGEIKTDALELEHGNLPQQITLNISDINLSDLMKDVRLGGMSMVGQMGGILPVSVEGDKIMVKHGILQSQSSGIARVSPYITKDIFPDTMPNAQRIRDALANYHYEFFELRLDGDLTGSTMMTLNASGYNPDLKDKTPVDVTFQIETSASSLLKGLLRK